MEQKETNDDRTTIRQERIRQGNQIEQQIDKTTDQKKDKAQSHPSTASI